MKKYIYMTVTIDNELTHCIKIDFLEHIKHSTNNYWYEVWTPGKNKTLHTGEIEFDISLGELPLVSEVLSRVLKRKTDNKADKNGN